MQEEQGSQPGSPETSQAGWTFNQETQTQNVPSESQPDSGTQPAGQAVSWTASEFIAHHKSGGWYLALLTGTALFAIGVFALTEDKISSIVVVLVGIMFAVFASRKPRELQYQLTDRGLQIADKFYPFANFKSFALMKEDGVGSVWLMPLKRFMPIITVYYAPQDEQKIADVLGRSLPIENRQPDTVDKLMQKARF